MLAISASNSQRKLVYAGLILAPFMGVAEISELLFGYGVGYGYWLIFIKSLKDLIIISSVLIAIIAGNIYRMPINNVSLLLIFATLFFSICYSFFYVPREALYSGVRWLMPIIFYLTFGRQDFDFYVYISRILSLIILFGVIFQSFQLFNMATIYGENLYGLSIRNPGFYLVPSSMAALALASLYFSVVYEPIKIYRTASILLIFICILLTSSGAGLISYSMFLFYYCFRRLIGGYFITLLSVVLLLIVIIALPLLTNREDVLNSPLARFDVILDHLHISSIFFVNTFGLGTNTLINLNPDSIDAAGALIADSMIGSSLVNGGIIFSLILIYELFHKPILKSKKIGPLYFLAFFPFFSSVVLFELFPVNILMFIALRNIIDARDQLMLTMFQNRIKHRPRKRLGFKTAQ